MSTPFNDPRLIEIAWRLDRLRWVPTDSLADIVGRDGSCLTSDPHDKPPAEALTDREFAARLCAGCPVQDECLELDLRTAGEDTAGVFGGLPEDDRRDLLMHWLQRGERAEGGD
ncbi:WhiB family transcriptional regulator [Saccharopolyspora sp. 6M]|uniref:WhiB family transcriptional regulator n=1 Tax=Saccharopolyspora sp. 6M TaxID=2877237 RepID=UPI001CD43157|nr:WhiB family transcriptional regulator [Saccharopolyspora sp. 6M]MCA1224924.1 WhiB family transcriptional regulator [Saccharopolyspora sp. 6M]